MDEGSQQACCDDTHWFLSGDVELATQVSEYCTLGPYFVWTSDDALSDAAEAAFWPFSCSFICFVQLALSQYSGAPTCLMDHCFGETYYRLG